MSLPAHLVFEQSFHVSWTYGVRVTAGGEKVNDSTERCQVETGAAPPPVTSSA